MRCDDFDLAMSGRRCFCSCDRSDIWRGLGAECLRNQSKDSISGGEMVFGMRYQKLLII